MTSLRFVDDAAGRVDAVEPGHVDVHDDDVRHERQRDLDGLLAGRSLADDLGVGNRLEQGTEAGPEERVIVGDEDPDRSAHAASLIHRMPWERRRHERPAAGSGADLAGATDLCGTLPHRVEPDTGRAV